MTSHERWAPVLGFEEYYSASSYGRVRRELTTTRTKAGRLLEYARDSRGKHRVVLCRPGLRRQRELHVVVWEAFNGPVPRGCYVAQKRDDELWPCALWNLELRPLSGQRRRFAGHVLPARDAAALFDEREQGMSYAVLVSRWELPLGILRREIAAERARREKKGDV